MDGCQTSWFQYSPPPRPCRFSAKLPQSAEPDRLLPVAGGVLLLLTAAAYWPAIRMAAGIFPAGDGMAHELFATVVAAIGGGRALSP